MDANDTTKARAADVDHTPAALRTDALTTSEPCLKGSPCDKPPSLPNLLIPDSSNRPLNETDVRDKDADQLGLMRNGIYAEHGRAFTSPKYRDFFQQNGFQVNPDFKASDLSSTEIRNVNFLNMTELDKDVNGQRQIYKGSVDDAQPNRDGVIMPDESKRLLKADELAKLADADLQTAINDIYAIHGYPFVTDQAKNHYSQFSWYQAKPDFAVSDLSWVEERNIELLNIAQFDRKAGSK